MFIVKLNMKLDLIEKLLVVETKLFQIVQRSGKAYHTSWFINTKYCQEMENSDSLFYQNAHLEVCAAILMKI